MKVYQVGGAVRDALLGKTPADIDYVVVGGSASEMLGAGFQQVGADFPVFIHPSTKQEYALARTEVKSGVGYTGFKVRAAPDVTLIDDLRRRDLTINSMAQDPDTGEVIDPFGGRADIQAKVFRHTSPAFADDPLRVLRIARLSARFGEGWTIAPETVAITRRMSADGLLSELTPERVWKELSRALVETSPRLFFDALQEMGALGVALPEIADLMRVQEDVRWHREGNTYEHTMLVLQALRRLSSDVGVMFAGLVHDFGKRLTDPANYPRHFGHESRGVDLVAEFAARLRVPSSVAAQAGVVSKYHMHTKVLAEMSAGKWLAMFTGLGAFRRPEHVEALRLVGAADMRGKLGCENVDVTHLDILPKVFYAAQRINMRVALDQAQKTDIPIGNAAAIFLADARRREIKRVLGVFKNMPDLCLNDERDATTSLRR